MSELKKITKSVPSGGMERPFVAEGTIEGFGKWTLDHVGLLVIDGKGKMPDWPPWHFPSFIKQVQISDGVTSIGRQAFSGCKSLTSIHIPDSVICIRDKAFLGCENLTSIHIPKGVRFLPKDTFYGCANLRQMTVPLWAVSDLLAIRLTIKYSGGVLGGYEDEFSFKRYYGIPQSCTVTIDWKA